MFVDVQLVNDNILENEMLSDSEIIELIIQSELMENEELRRKKGYTETAM